MHLKPTPLSSCDTTISSSTQDVLLLRLTFWLVLTANLACNLYASLGARGTYADGAALLIAIYDTQWFFVSGTRTVVDILRQTPIVLLSRYTSATLFECGQVFTFSMLSLPTILCAFCWLIAPRNRKSWILFPLTSLLIGFAATSTHAIGEAAIATSYYWILLFLLFFNTRSTKGQTLFLMLCIPAFWLHEGTFPLTGVLLVDLAMRIHTAAGRPRFAGIATILLAAIFVYQIRWVIFPAFPGDRKHIITGLMDFEFLYAERHFNLPLVTGAVALLALSAVFFINITQPEEKAARLAKIIAIAWGLFVLAAIATAVMVEQSFSPYSQTQARYHPTIISVLLGTTMILLLRFRVPDRSWMNPATISILISLCAAQVVADFAATRRWNAYTTDLQSRLNRGHGLIPWEETLQTGNERADANWRIFKIEWVIPYMCIIFAPDGVVSAMIDLPKDLTFRPLDPEKPDRLPKLRGIDYAPYKRFFIAPKSSG